MIQKPHSGHILRQNYNSKRYTHRYVHNSTHSQQTRHGNSLSTDRWMDKEDVVHIYNGIVLSCKKQNNAICNNMDETRDDHIKWSQKNKDKYHDITYVKWNHFVVQQKLTQHDKSIILQCERVCDVLCLVTQSHPNLCNSMDCSPPGSSVHGDSSGKNTGVGCHALLQGIFPTKGSNPGFPPCRQILYHLSHQGSPRILELEAHPFSRGTFQSRNQTGVSFITGGFFTSWATWEAP